jgi:hypothetical protein
VLVARVGADDERAKTQGITPQSLVEVLKQDGGTQRPGGMFHHADVASDCCDNPKSKLYCIANRCAQIQLN